MANKRKKAMKETPKVEPQAEKVEGTNNVRNGKLVLGLVVVSVILGVFILKGITNNNKQDQNIIAKPVPSEVLKNGNKSTVIVTNDTATAPIVKKLPLTKTEQFKYTVEQGDSLAKIGKIFCNDTREYLHLAQLNNITESVTLQPGDTITVECQ